jgi:hypothetical protein
MLSLSHFPCSLVCCSSTAVPSHLSSLPWLTLECDQLIYSCLFVDFYDFASFPPPVVHFDLTRSNPPNNLLSALIPVLKQQFDDSVSRIRSKLIKNIEQNQSEIVLFPSAAVKNHNTRKRSFASVCSSSSFHSASCFPSHLERYVMADETLKEPLSISFSSFLRSIFPHFHLSQVLQQANLSPQYNFIQFQTQQNISSFSLNSLDFAIPVELFSGNLFSISANPNAAQEDQMNKNQSSSTLLNHVKPLSHLSFQSFLLPLCLNYSLSFLFSRLDSSNFLLQTSLSNTLLSRLIGQTPFYSSCENSSHSPQLLPLPRLLTQQMNEIRDYPVDLALAFDQFHHSPIRLIKKNCVVITIKSLWDSKIKINSELNHSTDLSLNFQSLSHLYQESSFGRLQFIQFQNNPLTTSTNLANQLVRCFLDYSRNLEEESSELDGVLLCWPILSIADSVALFASMCSLLTQVKEFASGSQLESATRLLAKELFPESIDSYSAFLSSSFACSSLSQLSLIPFPIHSSHLFSPYLRPLAYSIFLSIERSFVKYYTSLQKPMKKENRSMFQEFSALLSGIKHEDSNLLSSSLLSAADMNGLTRAFEPAVYLADESFGKSCKLDTEKYFSSTTFLSVIFHCFLIIHPSFSAASLTDGSGKLLSFLSFNDAESSINHVLEKLFNVAHLCKHSHLEGKEKLDRPCSAHVRFVISGEISESLIKSIRSCLASNNFPCIILDLAILHCEIHQSKQEITQGSPIFSFYSKIPLHTSYLASGVLTLQPQAESTSIITLNLLFWSSDQGNERMEVRSAFLLCLSKELAGLSVLRPFPSLPIHWAISSIALALSSE